MKALINRSEENKTSASRDKAASTKSRSWLSRYEFAKDKSDDLVPAVAVETNGSTKHSAATPPKKQPLKPGLNPSAKDDILAKTPTSVKKESGLPTIREGTRPPSPNNAPKRKSPDAAKKEETRPPSPNNAPKRKSPESTTMGEEAGDGVEPSSGKKAKSSPQDASVGRKSSPQTNSTAAAGMDYEGSSCGVIDLCDSSDED